MKKSKKTPRIVIAVLVTLLVIGALVLLRNYLLSAYISADTMPANIIRQKTTLDGGFNQDTTIGNAIINGTSDIRLAPNTSAECPAPLLSPVSTSASPTPTASATASSSPASTPSLHYSANVDANATIYFTGNTADVISADRGGVTNQKISGGLTSCTSVTLSGDTTGRASLASSKPFTVRVTDIGTTSPNTAIAFDLVCNDSVPPPASPVAPFSCPTMSNITVRPVLTGGTSTAQSTKFYRGTSATALSSGATVSFSTRDGDVTAVKNAPGLKVGTNPEGYLQVSFSGQPVDTFVEGTLEFSGAYLTSASIVKDSSRPLETADTVSVDNLSNKVSFHLVSSGTTDNDVFLIYFCCGTRVEKSGTVEGSLTLDKAYIPSVFSLNFAGIDAVPNQTCTQTDIRIDPSADGVTFNTGSTGSKISLWNFSNQSPIKAMKYIITMKSCNGIDTPKLRNVQLRGSTPPISTATPVATCTATGTCTQDYVPVCGVDKKTYSNSCMAALSCVQVASQGQCPIPSATATLTTSVESSVIPSPSPTPQGTLTYPPNPVLTETTSVESSVIPSPSPTPQGTLTYPPAPVLTETVTSSPVFPPAPAEPTESLAPGQSPQASATPTVVVIDKVFNSQGSAGQFLASGIKSGPSFWIFILVVTGIGGYIVYRIAISKE